MKHNKFYIINGTVEKREEFFYDFTSFISTPHGIYRDIRLADTTPLFLKDHLLLLEEQVKLLHMTMPRKVNFDKIETYIYRLLNINKIYKGGYVRLFLLQNRKGDIPDFYLYTEPLTDDYYTVATKGLKADFLKANHKRSDDFSGIKHNIDILNTIGANFCSRNGIDTCFFLNDRDNISDSLHGNVFLVKDMNIYTPALSEGGGQEILREYIIATALKNDYVIYDDSYLSPEEILAADEVFIANDKSGILWVQQYKNKRFFNKVARHLTLLLNKDILRNNKAT